MKTVTVFACLLVLYTVANVQSGSINRLKRDAPHAENSTVASTDGAMDKPHEKTTCNEKEPCGWVSYQPFTRKMVNFLENTCICPVEMLCIKADDDLSASAFVYRCGNVKSSGDTNSS